MTNSHFLGHYKYNETDVQNKSYMSENDLIIEVLGITIWIAGTSTTKNVYVLLKISYDKLLLSVHPIYLQKTCTRHAARSKINKGMHPT